MGFAVTVAGARGGGVLNYGRGAIVKTVLALAKGAVLALVVGQAGVVSSANTNTGGGGGGSFVVANNTTPLVIAGGGGGVAQLLGRCPALGVRVPARHRAIVMGELQEVQV